MDYPVFVSLLLVLILAVLAIQAAILHGLSVALGFKGASIRKTLKVFGLLILVGFAVRVVFSVFPGQGGGALVGGLLALVVSLGLSTAVAARQYREGFARSFLVVFVLVAVGLAAGLTIRTYFAQAFRIPTRGMVPGLEANDYVFAAKFTYRTSEPERGDIVIFEFPPNRKLDYVKRIMGLPGETVEIRNRILFIDGRPADDPWGSIGETDGPGGRDPRFVNFGPLVVPAEEFFVMGDNRDNSLDSRFFGTVPRDHLVGKVLMRYWPLPRWGRVTG